MIARWSVLSGGACSSPRIDALSASSFSACVAVLHHRARRAKLASGVRSRATPIRRPLVSLLLRAQRAPLRIVDVVVGIARLAPAALFVEPAGEALVRLAEPFNGVGQLCHLRAESRGTLLFDLLQSIFDT